MLIDELREQLKQLEPDIETIKKYWAQSDKETQFQTLTEQTEAPDFWQHEHQASILKELQHIKQQKEEYLAVTNQFDEFHELLTLFEHDQHELEKLHTEIRMLPKKISSLKIQLLLNEPHDDANCFMSINPGAGGTESQDWAEMLLRMYVRFCERHKLSASVVDIQHAEEAGIKSATLFIKGPHAYGLLKNEQGIHRLVRISPFDASKRRHTSFAAVLVTPEAPEIEITIQPQDLRIDTYRSSGAGGQHVNTTDSAVRITHLPTNIVTQCQNERSQLQNKETAMKMLKAKLLQKQEEEALAKSASVEKKKIEWGSQIRSYVLHPYKLVKDHRTDTESQQPENVLDGDIMKFIEHALIAQ